MGLNLIVGSLDKTVLEAWKCIKFYFVSSLSESYTGFVTL